MNIENNYTNVAFDTLNSGDCFEFLSDYGKNNIYMKINQIDINKNAVNLCNGEIIYFTNDMRVHPVDAYLEIRR